MPRMIFCGAIACFSLMAGLAQAQQPSTAELIAQIEALKRRVDELESRQSVPKRQPEYKRVAAPTSKQTTAAPDALAAAAPATRSATPRSAMPAPPPTSGNIAGLRAPEPMGSQFEDALRSDLPGLSIRIPGTQSEVRIYGFAKVSAHRDFNGRNQTDAPAPQGIPLAGSPNDIQGGDFGMTARFSRIGLDTRSLTSFGTLETRIEGDFGGGAAASNNAVFRLRQAWAELGTETFRVLFGQANSLWNEGMYETLIDATNLNQSFVRQPQLRVIATLAPGLTGQVSLETPDTQYTSDAGIVTSGGVFNGGLSPAFTSLPDLLARLTYRNDGLEVDVRGLLRQLSIRTAGTPAAPPSFTDDELGWGVAGHVRFPMRWVSTAFGADQLIGMAYYGEGIGRYFAGNTSGQDALTSIGLLGTTVSFDPLTTYGATLAYRRFWTEQLRSNFAYSYARQEYPAYALGFTPGSAPATSLNSEMQQAIVNLIWSPFAQINGGTVNTGWLDVGLEYVYTRRDVFGGAIATAAAGNGYGVANRILAAGVGRF